MNPLVSIVMPAFNSVEFLKASLDSIVAQTYPDWELIVVDDGSTDATPEIVRDCQDQRIRLIELPHCGNPGLLRNIGIAQSAGGLVAFLDSDDLWLPTKLALQVDYILNHPEVGLVFCLFRYRYPEISRPGRKVMPDTAALRNPCEALPALFFQNLGTTSTQLVRKSCLKQVGGYPEKAGTLAEDYELNFRLASICKFGFVEEVLVLYSIHPASLSRDEMKMARDINKLIRNTLVQHQSTFPALQHNVTLKFQRYIRLGMACLLCGKRTVARKLFLSALYWQPLSAGAALLLLLSFLPRRLVGAVRRISHRIQ